MNWLLRTDGTEAGTVLLDKDTGGPVPILPGHKIVANFEINRPEPVAPPYPPGSDIPGDLAKFAAKGKEPPEVYWPWLPSKQPPHLPHQGVVRVLPANHTAGVFGAILVDVEPVAGVVAYHHHNAMHLANQPTAMVPHEEAANG